MDEIAVFPNAFGREEGFVVEPSDGVREVIESLEVPIIFQLLTSSIHQMRPGTHQASKRELNCSTHQDSTH